MLNVLRFLPVWLLALCPAWAETVMLDSMDNNHSRWGPARAERRLVKEGAAALRWTPQQGPIRRDDLAINLAKYHSLRLWIYSTRSTFARIKMDIPIGGNDNGFSLTFKVDWEGWNRMELPAIRFRGRSRAEEWNRARGLIFSLTERGYEPGDLILDGIEVSTDWPQIPINDHETLIDWLYWGAETLPLWRPTKETLQRPADSYGFDRYWCWGYLRLTEDAQKRDVCAYTRELDTDLTGYDALEIRLSNDTQGFFSAHIQVDGKWSTPVEYVKGTGHFNEIQIPLPRGAKRLNRITLDISEPPDDIGGSHGRNLKCNIMWILLRKRGAPIGAPPKKMAPIAPRPLNGRIETEGLPAGVYFGKKDLPRIRALLTKGVGRSVWNRTLAAANNDLTTKPEDYIGRWYPMRGWAESRSNASVFPLADVANRCALAFVITGEKKYGDMARRALLTMCQLDHWVGGTFARYPLGWGGHGNPFSESAFCYQVGLAYDWAYTTLSDEERRLVEDNLIRKGIRWTHDRLAHSPGLMTMNQGPVFDSGLGVALMALEPSHPALTPMRKQAEEWMWQAIANYSQRDGGSNEGIGYWHYTWNTAIRLLSAIAARDPDEFYARFPEHVKKSMDWLASMKTNTRGGFFSVFFCDAAGGAPSPGVSAFFAKYVRSSTAAWFQSRYNAPTDLLSTFLWEHEAKPESPPMILARHFRGVGYVFFREGFDYGDVLFTLLGQPPLGGHNQHDRTSFTIEAFGENLAMDPGMISYENPIHTSLARTRLHNAITIDGRDSAYNAKVIGFFSSPLVDYAAVDGAPSYSNAEHYIRKAIYLRPDHFVISDHIRLKEPGRIEWNLNSAGKHELTGSRAIATAQSAVLLTDFIAPREVMMETEVWPCGYGGVENHHATFFAPGRRAEQRFLVSLYPVRRQEEQQVEATPIRGDGFHGTRIVRGQEEDVVLERLSAEAMVFDELDTDAETAVVRRRDGALRGIAVFDGTRTAWQGQELVRATRSGNFSVEYRDASMAASLQAPPGAQVTLRRLDGKTPRSLLLGNVSLRFTASELHGSEGGLVFTVPQGDAPQGGYWLLIDKPAWLDVTNRRRAKLSEKLVDGKPMPAGGCAPGYVPERVRLTFEAGSNPLDPQTARAYFDGKPLDSESYDVHSSDDSRIVSVGLAVRPLLRPEELKPRFLTTHRLSVSLRDRSLMTRRVSGELRFSLLPFIEMDAVFLSDLKPVKAFVHGGVIRDTSYGRTPISLGGNKFPKGLTTHPETTPQGGYAEVVYDVKAHVPRHKRFRGVVGVEDDAAGSVQFCVYTRKRGGEWQERFRSEIMTSGMDPCDVSVPLDGVEELRLYVTDAGDGINSDHAMWGMARLE